MATHSGILAWRIPWTEEPGGLQSMGSQRVPQRLKCRSAHTGGARGQTAVKKTHTYTQKQLFTETVFNLLGGKIVSAVRAPHIAQLLPQNRYR